MRSSDHDPPQSGRAHHLVTGHRCELLLCSLIEVQTDFFHVPGKSTSVIYRYNDYIA